MNKIANIAIIPARLGSQRLAKKNLRKFGDVTLIEHAILRCKAAEVFDDIYLNSESQEFQRFADGHGIKFYQRPTMLGDNTSTSEDFISEFLGNVFCENIYQVHSITPLLSSRSIQQFVSFCQSNSQYDTVLSYVSDQIEVAYQEVPVNFKYDRKTNSQDLKPVQRITWAITKWRRRKFLDAIENNQPGTYSGSIGYYQVEDYSGLAIKTLQDLNVANALNELKRDE